jgi:hypothetical protein
MYQDMYNIYTRMYKHIYIYDIYIHPTVQLQLVFSVYKCVYIYTCVYLYTYIYVYFVCVVDSLHMAFMSHSLVGSRVSLISKHIVNN